MYKIRSACLRKEAALRTARAVVDLLFSTAREEAEELSEQHQVSFVLCPLNISLSGSSSRDS